MQGRDAQCGIGAGFESRRTGRNRDKRADAAPTGTGRDPMVMREPAHDEGAYAMIRHHFAGVAVSLALLLSLPVQAQTAQPTQPDIPQSHLAAGRDVVVVTGLADSFDSIFLEFRERVGQTVGTTRPEARKDMEEIIAALRPEADKKREEIVASAAFIFAKHMTEADLKAVTAFFKSPVGQRYNEARPRAIDEIYALLQPWSMQTSNFLFDRFSEEMRKRGHQM